MSEDRFRNWKFVIWLESAPIDYITRIQECGVRVILSPIHNLDPKDDNPLEFKKPHRHGILVYSGKKSYKQALAKVKEIGEGSINTVLACDDLGPAARYLCHLDHPFKHVYPIAQIECFNGISVEDAFTTASDLKMYDSQIMQFINENDVLYYHDLAEYAQFVNQEWRTAVLNRTMFWTHFLKARYTAKERNQYNNITRKTIEEFKKL